MKTQIFKIFSLVVINRKKTENQSNLFLEQVLEITIIYIFPRLFHSLKLVIRGYKMKRKESLLEAGLSDY